MKRPLLVAIIALGCARADEKSLRRVVEDRFQRYRGSRDTVAIESCRLIAFPETARGWLKFKFPDFWEAKLPPAGQCDLRFDLDVGRGERQTMTRAVRYVFMNGAWHSWQNDAPVY